MVSDKSSLFDVLTVAGGPTSDADLKKTSIVRGQESGASQRFRVNLEKVMREGSLDVMPEVSNGDTIFVPRAREKSRWRAMIEVIGDVSTVFVAYYIITGVRYR